MTLRSNREKFDEHDVPRRERSLAQRARPSPSVPGTSGVGEIALVTGLATLVMSYGITLGVMVVRN